MALGDRFKFEEDGADAAGTVLASRKNPDGTDFSPVAAATATEVTSGSADAQGVAATANLRLMGYSVRESAGGAAARLILRHGTAASDPALCLINLLDTESKDIWFGDRGIACAGGVFVDRVSGSSHIVLYTKAEA